jgi:hypothetical protein
MNLYHDINCLIFPSATAEELKGIESRAEDAVCNLLLGVSAIGSLMFWASASDDYSEKQAKDDMYNIGCMLQPLSETIRALNDKADNASFSRNAIKIKNKTG